MMMKKLNNINVELFFFLDIHLFEFGISMDFLTNGVSIQRWKTHIMKPNHRICPLAVACKEEIMGSALYNIEK